MDKTETMVQIFKNKISRASGVTAAVTNMQCMRLQILGCQCRRR